MAAGCLSENFVADAAGPDTFTFEELLRLLASAVGAQVRLVHTLPFLGLAATRLAGLLLRDVVLSRDQVDGLMAGLLPSRSAPTGATRLSEWFRKTPIPLVGSTCPSCGTISAGSAGRQIGIDVRQNAQWL